MAGTPVSGVDLMHGQRWQPTPLTQPQREGPRAERRGGGCDGAGSRACVARFAVIDNALRGAIIRKPFYQPEDSPWALMDFIKKTVH
jgi:hypothetical protein